MASKHQTMELEIYAQDTKVVEDYLNKTIEEICSDSGQNLKNAGSKTDLSEYCWKLKDESKPYEISWSVVEKVPQLKIGNRYCALCIADKRNILFSDPKVTINKRNKSISKCRHQNKFKLSTVKEENNVDIPKHTMDSNINHHVNIAEISLSKHQTMELEINAQGTNVVEDYFDETIEEICTDSTPRNTTVITENDPQTTEIVHPNSNATNSHNSEPGTIFLDISCRDYYK